MEPRAMTSLIDEHLAAERRGDPDGSVAVYTDDVEHDLVGLPTGPVHGKRDARRFYEQLSESIETEAMVPIRRYDGKDFCVIEHDWTGTVNGELLGLPGNGRRITFRMLHVWEFRDGLISRENVWLDVPSIASQLAAPDGAAEGIGQRIDEAVPTPAA